MSEEVRDEWKGLEIVSIAAQGKWFDIIGMTLYENHAPFSIRLGLGHTPRKVDLIVIDKATEEDEKKLKMKAIEGEVIE